jgi:hypothetical protein
MAERKNESLTLKQLLKNKEIYGGKASCSVRIKVEATNILAGVADSELANLKAKGLPWQIWEGAHLIWDSAKDDYLKFYEKAGEEKVDKFAGCTTVVVAELLQAVLETHPAWTIRKLVDVTATESEAEAKLENEARAEVEAEKQAGPNGASVESVTEANKLALDKEEAPNKAATADRLAAAARLAATRAGIAADLAKAADEAAKAAYELAAAAVKASAVSEEEFTRAKAKADVATWLAVTAVQDAAVAASRAADAAADGDNPADIYRNFTIRVNVGVEPEENWVALPIDMCLHGGC